jgi:hypothetical protein
MWPATNLPRRWVAEFGRWVAGFGSEPACYGSSLGSNPDISQKYKKGWRHKQRSGHRTAVNKKNLKFKIKKSAKSLVYLEYKNV